MKLFNKTIDRQLFKQYSLGSDLSKQEVVAKIFNPYGAGTWFILNSDPEDPEYLWAIVDLGYGAEVGSVGRSELENYRNRMGWGFERDLSFEPVNALELYNGLREGKYYTDGGNIEKIKEGDKVVYKDNVYLVSKIETRNVQGIYDVQYHLHSYKRNLQDVVVDNVKFIKKFADGGNIEDFSDNQQMIMNQNVEVEHHHEELEDILEDKIPVPAWVVAKMETATQNLSDITHYLDGQKELMEDEMEDQLGEDDDDDDDDEMEMEEIENKEVVEPINVSAGTKEELTKKFTDDAMGNLKGFLKGMEGIDLRDDYTFDYKDEQYEVEPIINSDENGVSNAVFSIFDGDGEEVGDISYSREGGKQKFTANSEFFSWNNAKFEDGGFMNNVYADGGYFDGTIPNVSSYMSTYAKGGSLGTVNPKYKNSILSMINYKIDKRIGDSMSDISYTEALNLKNKINKNEPISSKEKNYISEMASYLSSKRLLDKVADISYTESFDFFDNIVSMAKGGEVAKAEILGLSKNILGTASIEMKISGMRKSQDFSVYPIGKDDSKEIITIQSETRIGKIDLSTGRGLMSQSHSNGAYFVHFQMDKLTPFTINEKDLKELRTQIFKTAGDNVGSRGIVSDNSGASSVYAKGGGVGDYVSMKRLLSEFKNEKEIFDGQIVNRGTNDFKIENDNFYIKRPNENWKIFRKIKYAKGGKIDNKDLEKLNAYWQSFYKGIMAGKKDDGYITITNKDELNKYITSKLGNVVKNIELIEKGKNYPYNDSYPYYEDIYSVDLKDGTTFKIVRSYGRPRWQGNVDYKEQIIVENINQYADGGFMNDVYAKGGMVVTSVKDIPNFKERLEQRRITYRGLGMGKVADDFYKLAGTGGTRIKVDGKEYFITDKEFDTFSRGTDGKMQIKFDAPARKGYADGGSLSEKEQILKALENYDSDDNEFEEDQQFFVTDDLLGFIRGLKVSDKESIVEALSDYDGDDFVVTSPLLSFVENININGNYADGGFLDKYEVDRFKQVMNGKAIAKYIVRLQDSYGNKETYVFGIKLKDQFKGCVLVPYESLYGGWSNSGIAFSLGNLQVEKLVPNSFSKIELDEQETEMLVNKLVNKNQAGVEKFLNSQFFYLNYNQTFKDVLRGHLALSVARVSSIEFQIVQKFADGGSVEKPLTRFRVGESFRYKNNGSIVYTVIKVYNDGACEARDEEGDKYSFEFDELNELVKAENNYADGGFMNDVYADGGQVRTFDGIFGKEIIFKEEQVGKFTIGISSGFNNRRHVFIYEGEIGKYGAKGLPKDFKMSPQLSVEFADNFYSNLKRKVENNQDLTTYELIKDVKFLFADGGFMNDVYAKGGKLNFKERSERDSLKLAKAYQKVLDSDFDETEYNKYINIVKETQIPKEELQKIEFYISTTPKGQRRMIDTYRYWGKNEFAKGGNLKKYILKADIKTVTVKRNGKEVTYKGADVLNGANVLAKGGDISSKANYIPKRDVVEVELKDGSKVKPANGYWVKKGAEPVGAEPTPTASRKSETKVGETYIRKDMRGNWKAETNIDNFNDYDWRLSTIKIYSGKLITSAQGGKTEPTGSKGYEIFKYTPYEDPNYTLEVSSPKRLTEKVVSEQHVKGLAKFKKFMETGTFGRGGKISNFDKLSAKVAKQYEGKPVKSQYQEEYGKYYSKEEAQEVGDKVAGKVKAMQPAKKEMGGETKKRSGSEMLKQANILAKEIRKDGESWNDAKKRAFAQLKK